MWLCTLDSCTSEQCPVAGPCEHNNGQVGSVKVQNFSTCWATIKYSKMLYFKDLVRNVYYAICDSLLRIWTAIRREINININCGFHCFSLCLCFSDYKLNFAGYFTLNFNDLGKTPVPVPPDFLQLTVRGYECFHIHTEKPCLEPQLISLYSESRTLQ